MASHEPEWDGGMIISEFGLFWRADEINWNPGSGKSSGIENQFRLLGRIGKNKSVLKVADFRQQRGIYILYGNWGPHYVGLNRKQDLGKRLKDHLTDEHAGKWDRFSWFGFRRALKSTDSSGFQTLKELAANKTLDPNHVIRDVEALLIKAMALRNKSSMNFVVAREWVQIKRDELSTYCDKVG